MVGIRFAEMCQTTTLIVTNSAASVKQWKQSLLDFTDLTEDQISCYDANNKTFAPVTICTYHMLAYKSKGEFIHFNRFIQQSWGALILDEVHLMPANMFRIVASFQATKRLALTATFVREDGREKDIFTLIGPKRYDKPWKDLEAQGYIASVNLKELRVPLTKKDKKSYLEAKNYQDKLDIAVMSENKVEAIRFLLAKHKGEKILIIGQFVDQLEVISGMLNIPVVHGQNSDKEREFYYDKMRSDNINELIASSIANAALDIPGISVVIQISFLGGSRNEEAQRVGRATRPKDCPAYFYTLVSKDTMEEAQNFNRQQFLTGEGYKYEIQEMAMVA
jgi:DNA excision repair protein ERCC-3